LTTTEVSFGKGELTIPGAPALVAELRTRRSFRERVRNVVAGHLDEFLDQARTTLTDLRERAQKLGHADIFVAFDSLEKLRGISTNWEDVLRSAENVFDGGAPHLRMPIKTLYTVPFALAVRRNMGVALMPAVKVRDRAGRPSELGIAAMRMVLERRVPREVWPEVFGEDADARVDRLILRSGGYLREFIEMIRDTFLTELPIAEHDLRRIIFDIADRYRRIILGNDFAWLARVARDKYLTVDTVEQRKAADRLLLDNVIVRYENDDAWFELHPAVVDIPGVQAELVRLDGVRQRELWPNDPHDP
jgi:hypothetical protein